MIPLTNEVMWILIYVVLYPKLLLVADPLNRMDVIGQYRMTNEKQCQRLCWYRQPCFSYSFRYNDLGAPSSSSDPNCILHTSSEDDAGTMVSPSPAPQGVWEEKAASNSSIHNACRARPCDNSSVCVPHHPHHHPSSFRCLSLPASCGHPPPVDKGQVSVTGTQQGDTARVTCDRYFVASPKDVVLDIICQLTSRWTPFTGSCLQYEFPIPPASRTIRMPLPRPVEESCICIQGSYAANFEMAVNFRSNENVHDLDMHLMIRSQQIQWTTRRDEVYGETRIVGNTPLSAGDSFTLILLQMPDHLRMTLNTQHVYNISLSNQPGDGGLDLSRSKFMDIGGSAVYIDYLNLLYGCSMNNL